MRTELVRDVPIVRYAAFAEMAWLERRPELGTICLLARDAGRRITPAVVERALPGLGEVGTANLVRSCTHLGLCDRSGALSRLGEDAAETNEAHIPEQGVYDFWVATDLLLGSRALHVQRIASATDGRFGDITALPLQPDPNAPFVSVADSRARFVVRAFPSNHSAPGGIKRKTSADCQIRWVLDWQHERTEFQLEGTIDPNGTQALQHVAEGVDLDLWELMDSWSMGPLRPHGLWSTGDRRLMVSFETVAGAPDQQDTFTRDIDLGEVDVPRFGRWNADPLTSVPIGPADPRAAQAWAMSRLDRHLRGDDERRTRADVRRLFVELTESTPLAPFAPTLPSHDQLLGRYVEEPGVFWRMACAVDLGPQRTSPAELAPLVISEDELDTPPGITDQGERFFVPYRANWSMRDLVNRLTAGQTTRRVLLVDRYVRGQENLVSLGLLHAALAERGCAGLDVWTGNDYDDDALQAIEQVTGRRPHRIREVIGRHERLHDRYLVVVPDGGQAFGWQMSNSPLDARAPGNAAPSPGTALRWRDMMAGRLSGGQLRQAMTAWIDTDMT